MQANDKIFACDFTGAVDCNLALRVRKQIDKKCRSRTEPATEEPHRFVNKG